MTSEPISHAISTPKTRSLANKTFIFWLISLTLLAILGAGMELYVTRDGAGASGDSVHYLDGARNILAGNGFGRQKGSGEVTPITQFPPFYSIALAGLGLLGIDLLDAARVLNAVLFGINVALAGLLIYRLSRSIVASLLGSALTLTAYNLLLIHAWVMSEPLYLSLTLIAILGLLAYEKNHNLFLLVLTGLVIGLGVLTRYLGFALLAAAPLWILLYTGKASRHNWAGAFLVGLTGLLPVSLWVIRNALVSTTVTGRIINFHPPSPDLVTASLEEFSSWVVPGRLHLSWAIGVSILAVLFLASLAVFLRKGSTSRQDGIRALTSQPGSHVPELILFYLGFYFLVLILDATWLDASMNAAGIRRYLIPVFVFLLIWIVDTLHHLDRSHWERLARAGFFIAGLAMLVIYSGRAVGFLRNPGNVFGYTDIKRQIPEIAEGLSTFDPARPILASDYELVFFLAGRPPYALPVAFDNVKQMPNADYAQKMEEAKEMIRNGAVLVMTQPESQWTGTEKILSQGLVIWHQSYDYIIYIDPRYLQS